MKVSTAKIQAVRDYVTANPGASSKQIQSAINFPIAIVWEALTNLKNAKVISGLKTGRNIGYSVTETKQAAKAVVKSTTEKKVKKAKADATVEPVAVAPTVEPVKSDKTKGRNFGRNFGRLMVNGIPLHKGKAADAIVREYVKANNPTYTELKKVFPDSLLKTYGIFTDIVTAKQKAGRYFTNRSITLKDGKKIAVCSQFTADNIQPLLAVATTLKFVITVE